MIAGDWPRRLSIPLARCASNVEAIADAIVAGVIPAADIVGGRVPRGVTAFDRKSWLTGVAFARTRSSFSATCRGFEATAGSRPTRVREASR
jgi:hypothetical protein